MHYKHCGTGNLLAQAHTPQHSRASCCVHVSLTICVSTRIDYDVYAMTNISAHPQGCLLAGSICTSAYLCGYLQAGVYLCGYRGGSMWATLL
jgi:hypothetical protein